MRHLRLWILLIIVVIAGVFRFYAIASNPPSLTWDEVAWSYNAWSIGIDGKDEFGRFLPHDYLESFGDYKPPVYAYLDILPVKVFGLNELATRFPSAFFGTLTVLMTYLLTKAIFYTSKKKEEIGLIAAGILAISPWHIMLSRAAFEANVASFFIVTGVWLFLESIHGKRMVYFISVASFILSMYTFNSARIVSPLLLGVFTILFWKRIADKRIYIASLVMGVVLLLPTLKFLFSPQASLRFKEVNIFTDVNVVKILNTEVSHDDNTKWSKVIHNRRLAYGVDFLQHYFDHFNPTYLFISGDGNPKFSLQDVGEMYLWDLPFFVTGLLFLCKRREGDWWLIPVWLLIGIIPAATARETPHALRTEATIPTFQLFTAYGIYVFLDWLKNIKSSVRRNSIYLLVFGSLVINVFYFGYKLFVQYPRVYSYFWQYGYVDSIKYVQQVQKNYDAVSVADTLGRPYIYYLFYMHILPGDFRENSTVARDAFSFVTVSRINKIYFVNNNMPVTLPYKNILYINDPDHMPKTVHVQRTFYLKNGEPILVAYTL